MSAATTAAAGSPPAKGKMKVIVVVAVVVLVLALGGVGALLMLKKSAAAHDDEDYDAPAPAVSSRDPKVPPVFTPLDPFTVNLADKDAERYAQVGITLEMSDQAAADALKVFMPAVRNNVLLLLAHKTSAELMARDGKEQLAREVLRETALGMGYEVPDEDEEADADRPPSRKKRRHAEPALPVTAVYFSTFIIQ